MNVLKYTLRSLFAPADANYDATLLPDKKIRLAWQVMHNNGSAPDAKNVDSATVCIATVQQPSGFSPSAQ